MLSKDKQKALDKKIEEETTENINFIFDQVYSGKDNSLMSLYQIELYKLCRKQTRRMNALEIYNCAYERALYTKKQIRDSLRDYNLGRN